MENIQNNQNIFEALRAWRRDASMKAGIPPYFIFSNQTMANIANFIPLTMEELLSVKGIGTAKSQQYGEDILRIVNLNITVDNQRFIEAGTAPEIDPETGEVISKKEKRSKEPKEKKLPTHHISCYMLKSGLSISEIATERGIQERTVEEHLSTCIEEKRLDATTLITTEVIDRIAAYHRANPGITSLKEIFLAHDKAIPYSSLRFAISHLKSSGNW